MTLKVMSGEIPGTRSPHMGYVDFRIWDTALRVRIRDGIYPGVVGREH